jgi:predicted N-formylglutamate amidohydrolase
MSAPSSPEAGPGRPDDTTVTALAAEAAETLRPQAASPYLLIAEHAGNRVPAPWRDLGLPPPFLDTHFAVDIGIDTLTRRLSERLGAPAVLARWSRLFLDYNRPAGEWDHMRPDLGGIPVPGNFGADERDRELRRRIAWAPLEQAIATAAEGRRALVSVHSFTPVMGGARRNVDIGVLWREMSPFVAAVLEALQAAGFAAGFKVGDNEPYDWRQAIGYTLDRHGLRRGMPCFYLEVRNDLLADPETFGPVAQVVEDALASVAVSLWPEPVEAA